ncbi:exodeoxyribonuclease VII large subunit [Orrella sp. JC864]|uniref:exodeoxyribonuclease VII large subunit n=1 Tax=Orrella sp. JC864 TaxID=3120298 RepID=UPI003008BDB9
MTTRFPVTNDDLARKILTVAQLNQAVGQILEASFPLVWVTGEISNFTQAASGHWYFTLKDRQAAVRAVMFRSRSQALGFSPRAGDKVDIHARVGLYEPRGDFQLQVEAMRPAGQGNLYEAFVRLKEKLAAQGLFDAQRKRVPPALPRAVGVVTSLQAAALRDVLTALRRRAPHVPVVIYPAPVQGAEAAPRLVQAIEAANARREVDTLLLVRGGGSMEDLWSFNDEALAYAILDSAIPVICGVGHETDFTIADFVADLRAPTPTAAAELAALPRADWLARLARLDQALARAQARRLERAAQRLDRACAQLVSPAQRLAQRRERLAGLTHRLGSAMQRPLARQQGRLALLRTRLLHRGPDPRRAQEQLARAQAAMSRAARRSLGQRALALASLQARLRALDPGQTLARGYAIARDEQGAIVRQAGTLAAGQALHLEFAQGSAQVQVRRTQAGGGR